MDESVGDLLPEPIKPGRRLGSNYLVGERLGRGAMGVVHEATTQDGRSVAVKFLRAELAADHKTVARFLQERQIFRTVKHPNVVRVHDLVAEGDDLAIVMERVSGGDLKQRIENRSLTARQSMTIASEVAAGLATIHRANVVHRDLKPANILLTEDLSPKISDFGISRLVTEAMTRTSATIGTPIYMAPEAADQRGADAPADVYALGIMMFELLVGRAPFVEGGTFAVLRAHAMDRPPRIEGIPSELADLIDAMLAKDPAARPTIDVANQRLTQLLPQIGDDVHPVPVLPPPVEPQNVSSGEVTGPAVGDPTAVAGPGSAAGVAVGAFAAAAGPASGAAPPADSPSSVADSSETAIHTDPAASGDPAARSGDPVYHSGDPAGGSDQQPNDPTAAHPGLAGAGAGAAVAAAVSGGADGFQAPASGFGGLSSHTAENIGGLSGAPFAPGHHVETRRGLLTILPNRIPRRVIEAGLALGSLAAVAIVAFLLMNSGGGDETAIDSGDFQTTNPASAGTNSVGGSGDDGSGPTPFGSDEGTDPDQDGDGGDADGSTSSPVTETTIDGTTSTTDPDSTTSTSESTTTTDSTTSTTTSTSSSSTSSSTTSSTTTSTTAPPTTPVQIISGPTVNQVNSTSFQFNYRINDVCGSGSFTVTEVGTDVVAGSFIGDGSCYGPVHGGFPGLGGSAEFGHIDIKPDTTYRVSVTVRGVASDGTTPAGSGTDSTSFMVTTPAA